MPLADTSALVDPVDDRVMLTFCVVSRCVQPTPPTPFVSGLFAVGPLSRGGPEHDSVSLAGSMEHSIRATNNCESFTPSWSSTTTHTVTSPLEGTVICVDNPSPGLRLTIVPSGIWKSIPTMLGEDVSLLGMEI
jgi:hypothetical protein